MVGIKGGSYRSEKQNHRSALLPARGIDPLEAKEALLDGEIIEDYPEDKRSHSCLVYGKSNPGKDIHVLCGQAFDMLWVITVYEPDEAEWIDPRTRRVVK